MQAIKRDVFQCQTISECGISHGGNDFEPENGGRLVFIAIYRFHGLLRKQRV